MPGAAHPDVRWALPRERQSFVELLAELGDDEWSAPTECPAWSVGGVALHVLGDDLSLLSRQRDRATPGLVRYAQDHPGLGLRALLDGFNEQWVHAAGFMSSALVVELLRITGAWTASYYDDVDPEALGEPVGFFGSAGPSPYWQISGREYVERWVHHHQVRRAVDRPDLGPELLAPALDVVAHGLAGSLRDLGAAAGTRLAVTIPEVGAWTLRRLEGDSPAWAVGADEPARAHVELRIERALATPVFSRGLSRPEAEAAFTVAGDAALGERARDAVARLAARS